MVMTYDLCCCDRDDVGGCYCNTVSCCCDLLDVADVIELTVLLTGCLVADINVLYWCFIILHYDDVLYLLTRVVVLLMLLLRYQRCIHCWWRSSWLWFVVLQRLYQVIIYDFGMFCIVVVTLLLTTRGACCCWRLACCYKLVAVRWHQGIVSCRTAVVVIIVILSVLLLMLLYLYLLMLNIILTCCCCRLLFVVDHLFVVTFGTYDCLLSLRVVVGRWSLFVDSRCCCDYCCILMTSPLLLLLFALLTCIDICCYC